MCKQELFTAGLGDNGVTQLGYQSPSKHLKSRKSEYGKLSMNNIRPPVRYPFNR